MTAWSIRTPADLARLVIPNVTAESLHLDFKAGLDRGPGAQAELGRDVSQFANNQGGCLLLGVRERLDPATGIKTAVSLDGVADADRCREDIEAWIRNVLVPADFSRTIDFVRTSSSTFVAVNIPASRRLIWVADPGQQNRLEVVRRTNHGKEYMRPGEIERHWSNTLRSAQIGFNDAFELAKTANGGSETALPVEIVGGILRVSAKVNSHSVQKLSGRPTLKGWDATGFELRVPTGNKFPTIRIPFELLSTAWVDDAAIYVLCLAPIVFDAEAEALRFDPFGFIQR